MLLRYYSGAMVFFCFVLLENFEPSQSVRSMYVHICPPNPQIEWFCGTRETPKQSSSHDSTLLKGSNSLLPPSLPINNAQLHMEEPGPRDYLRVMAVILSDKSLSRNPTTANTLRTRKIILRMITFMYYPCSHYRILPQTRVWLPN